MDGDHSRKVTVLGMRTVQDRHSPRDGDYHRLGNSYLEDERPRDGDHLRNGRFSKISACPKNGECLSDGHHIWIFPISPIWP